MQVSNHSALPRHMLNQLTRRALKFFPRLKKGQEDPLPGHDKATFLITAEDMGVGALFLSLADQVIGGDGDWFLLTLDAGTPRWHVPRKPQYRYYHTIMPCTASCT